MKTLKNFCELFVTIFLIFIFTSEAEGLGFGMSLSNSGDDHEYGTYGISSPFGGIGINTEKSDSKYSNNNFFDTFRSSIFDDYAPPTQIRATKSMLNINHQLNKLSQKRQVANAFTQQEFGDLVNEYSASKMLGIPF
ncbi:hypothetical protein SNEBB_007654 [Seison nebaliae]|nr:hypothetical protein SNEBB_007654 [Seison nebaliae]